MEINKETGEVIKDNADLFTALAQAQAEFTPVATDKEVDFGTKDGRRVKYAYASFAAIFKMAQKPLTTYGLSVFQTMIDGNLITHLAHKSGQSITSISPLPTSNDIKQLGAALSYLRRYQYTAIIGAVVTDEDNENAVEGKVTQQPQRKQSSPPGPDTNPKKGEHRTPVDNFFDEIQKLTANYYSGKEHLYNTLQAWPDFSDANSVDVAKDQAVKHAKQKADEKAAEDEDEQIPF